MSEAVTLSTEKAPAPVLPEALTTFLNNDCTHRVFCPATIPQLKRPVLVAENGVLLQGKPNTPNISVTFFPKLGAMSKMEEMRSLGGAVGIGIGKPNLTFHGETKLALLETNGVTIDRSPNNNLAHIKAR